MGDRNRGENQRGCDHREEERRATESRVGSCSGSGQLPSDQPLLARFIKYQSCSSLQLQLRRLNDGTFFLYGHDASAIPIGLNRHDNPLDIDPFPPSPSA